MKLLGESPKWTDKAIVILTLGIFGAAALQTYIFHRQRQEMTESGRQTDRIIAADQRLAAANERFADAMEASNTSNRESLEKTLKQSRIALNATVRQSEIAQRAWVYAIVQPASEDHFEAGKPFDIRITTKNTGKTPATNVSSVSYVTIVQIESSPDLALPRPTFKQKDYVPFDNISPDSTRYGDFVYNLTETDVERINGGRVRIYAWGRIQYDDVFGVHHWTTFCSFLLSGGAFAVCPKYNDADKNQPRNLTE